MVIYKDLPDTATFSKILFINQEFAAYLFLSKSRFVAFDYSGGLRIWNVKDDLQFNFRETAKKAMLQQ
jgi:hypothetical protein